MKNADMPAYPLSGDAYTDFAAYDGSRNTSYNPDCQGMTKRERFAMAAPNEIPYWFEENFNKGYKKFESPLTDQEKEDRHNFVTDNFGYKRFDEGEKAHTKYSLAMADYQRNKQESMFFAWRVYYADFLLNKLDGDSHE